MVGIFMLDCSLDGDLVANEDFQMTTQQTVRFALLTNAEEILKKAESLIGINSDQAVGMVLAANMLVDASRQLRFQEKALCN